MSPNDLARFCFALILGLAGITAPAPFPARAGKVTAKCKFWKIGRREEIDTAASDANIQPWRRPGRMYPWGGLKGLRSNPGALP
jgi:hypothetical protein